MSGLLKPTPTRLPHFASLVVVKVPELSRSNDHQGCEVTGQPRGLSHRAPRLTSDCFRTPATTRRHQRWRSENEPDDVRSADPTSGRRGAKVRPNRQPRRVVAVRSAPT